MDAKSTGELFLAAAVIVLGASGTYLLLPHRQGEAKPRQAHIGGGVLVGLAILLFATFWTPPGAWLRFSDVFLYLFGFATFGSGLMTITSRNPIYSALWFAAVVLGSSGLFLLAGAQFLAAGTVIVYAGAIIVTFLFVIMLAQMEGRAPYDRSARSPFLATFTCYALLFGLLYALFLIPTPLVVPVAAHPAGAGGVKRTAEPRLTPTADLGLLPNVEGANSVAEVVNRASRRTARLEQADGLEKPHVAGLGETLYTDHLVTVELTGALLFVALVGALMIAAPKPPVRPSRPAELGRMTGETIHSTV